MYGKSVKDIETFRSEPQEKTELDSFEFEDLQIRKEDSFQDFIRDVMRDKDRERHGEEEWIRNRTLAKRLGLSTDMCTKVLNRQKDNQSRDCVIAICVALEMTVSETDKALRLYGYRGLDVHIERDRCVISILTNNAGAEKGEWIEDANRVLVKLGHDPLVVVNHRDSSKKGGRPKKRIQKVKPKPNHKILSTRFCPVVYADPYCSLSTEWNLDRFKVEGRMLLSDEENGTEYLLMVDPYGGLSMRETRMDSEEKRRVFESPDEAGEFREYFNYLLGIAGNGIIWLKRHLDDTRNYYVRTGADVRGDSIHVFAERYNYELSERNEYYLMEYENETYRLSVFHESAFMSRYLGDERYERQYGKKPPLPIRTYDSADEAGIETTDGRISSFRKKAFSDLVPEIEKILEGLRKNRLRVRDVDSFLAYSDEVCRVYGVEKEFGYETKYKNPYSGVEYEPGTPEAETDGTPLPFVGSEQADFQTEDGRSVKVTLDQLKRAFDLGCDDIGQICRIIGKYGTIEAVLR